MANVVQSLTNRTTPGVDGGAATMTLTSVYTYHRLVAVVTNYIGPGPINGAVPIWLEVSLDSATSSVWTIVPNGQVDLVGNGQYHAPIPSGAVPFPALFVRAHLGAFPAGVSMTVNAWIASVGL